MCKNGHILLKKTQILERWTEYKGELLEDDRGERLQMVRDIEAPPNPSIRSKRIPVPKQKEQDYSTRLNHN